mgnify:CR=1 FL=1
MRFALTLLVVIANLSITPDASAIIRRHDRPDRAYLELGSKYPAVTRLGGGTATLIAPEWIITAAHVSVNLTPFDHSVEFGGRSYRIVGMVRHPKWRAESGPTSVDIALLKLHAPVAGVEPARPYQGRDEKGMKVIFVGPGMSGTGQTGPRADDGKWRGARNTVEDVLENWVTFKFDEPPAGDELEGISGPGDSGGPALVETDEGLRIIGVSSANDDKGAAGPCRYHSTEYYARVSSVIGWLNETMKSPPPPLEDYGKIIDLKKSPFPKTKAGRVAKAFFKAWSSDDADAMAAFERKHRAAAALEARPVEERVESWQTFRAEWGALKPRLAVKGRDNDLYLLVRAEKEGVWKTFQFILEPEKPHKLTGINIGSPAPAPRE